MDLSLINSNQITLKVDFSIEQVQTAIAKLLEKKSILYILEDNSSVNSYKLDVYNGINPATITLSLQKNSETQTVISAIAQNASGGHASDIMLTEVLQDFFKFFNKYLTGHSSAEKSGCMGKAAMITTLLAATISLLFLV
ncbi:MAG: hypothetical protein PHR53_04215 [Bacteroidales bacterium]|nr:hypothetical protein [Bacteroidales bacterium]